MINKEGLPGEVAESLSQKPHEKGLQQAEKSNTLTSYHEAIFDNMPDWVWEIDQYGFITYSNSKVKNLLGYSTEKILENSFLQLVPKSDAINARTLLTREWEIKDTAEYIKHYFVSKEGKKILFETSGSAFFDAHNNKHGTRFFSRPVNTTPKTEERKMKMAVFAANNLNVAIAISNSEMLITYVNNALTDMFGYSEEELIGQPLAILGTDENSDYSQARDVSIALRENNIWNGEAQRRAKSGQYIPCIISARAINDKNDQRVCYVGTYLDMRPINHSALKNQNSLKKVINIICNAIEDRSVIKSQHQERVTDLAVAIAFEMGKSVQFIDGLTLASRLHDIGEMYIPPEIASRVGKLSESEYEMIRTHPKKGYEILREIDLPWPVAEIVLQHHERIDGSGYPNNLRGDEIMMEARIIAVADLVETMLTDRPYRPACTLAECVEELENNRGILYDALVVDICLRLIRENNYFLKSF